jgi:glutamate 5-kinase
MKIVIKIGTQSILSEHGIPSLVEQIVQLKQEGHHVVLVSSGAIGLGRKTAHALLEREYGSSVGEKQLLASIGQLELMHLYTRLFKTHQILVSQLLLTKQDFQTEQHHLNISRLLHEIFVHKNIVPIINENDSVAVEGIMFTDNDELAGIIAADIHAEKLIILSHVEGVYDAHPEDPNAQLISFIDPDKNWPTVSFDKSDHGRGGMLSKLDISRKMSELRITTHIASIDQPSVVLRILNQESVGTTILPVSSLV